MASPPFQPELRCQGGGSDWERGQGVESGEEGGRTRRELPWRGGNRAEDRSEGERKREGDGARASALAELHELRGFGGPDLDSIKGAYPLRHSQAPPGLASARPSISPPDTCPFPVSPGLQAPQTRAPGCQAPRGARGTEVARQSRGSSSHSPSPRVPPLATPRLRGAARRSGQRVKKEGRAELRREARLRAVPRFHSTQLGQLRPPQETAPAWGGGRECKTRTPRWPASSGLDSQQTPAGRVCRIWSARVRRRSAPNSWGKRSHLANVPSPNQTKLSTF